MTPQTLPYLVAAYLLIPTVGVFLICLVAMAWVEHKPLRNRRAMGVKSR